MPQHFYLADFRKSRDLFAHICGAQRLRGVDFRYIESRQLISDLTGGTLLEDQVFVLDNVGT